MAAPEDNLETPETQDQPSAGETAPRAIDVLPLHPR